MSRSNRSTAEFEAAAMLLGEGWAYDHVDHTYVGPYHNDGLSFTILDADTMAPLEMGDEIAQRTELVRKGLLGLSDAYPQERPNQVPNDGQDDPATATAPRGDTS